MTEEKFAATQPPHCTHCAHYFITHDSVFRYGCRAMDFKSQRLPMLDVLAASGQVCQFFQKNQRRKLPSC